MKQPAHKFAFYWLRYKFKLSGLVLLLPFWFLYQSLHQQFPPTLPKAQLGPFDVSVMPLTEDGPYPHHGEWVKDYYLQWCKGCVRNPAGLFAGERQPTRYSDVSATAQ